LILQSRAATDDYEILAGAWEAANWKARELDCLRRTGGALIGLIVASNPTRAARNSKARVGWIV
jgi:hypothetical protein